jgi:hypothetical protein
MVSFALPIVLYLFGYLYAPLNYPLNVQHGLNLPTLYTQADFSFNGNFLNNLKQCPSGTYQSGMYSLKRNLVHHELLNFWWVLLNSFNIDLNNVVVCTTCPRGTCCPTSGLKSPQACPVGYWCPGGLTTNLNAASNCSEHPCPVGNITKIINGTGAYLSSQCYNPCASNQCQVVSNTNQITCVNQTTTTSPCPMGHGGPNITVVSCSKLFTVNTTSSGCPLCSSGTYSNGTVGCKNCAFPIVNTQLCNNNIGVQNINYTCNSTNGLVKNTYGTCNNCTAGNYINNTLSDPICTPCGLNTYTTSSGQTSCISCPSNTVGPCSSGYSGNITTYIPCSLTGLGTPITTPSCVLCPTGTYSSGNTVTSANLSTCQTCPDGSFTNSNGSSLCIACYSNTTCGVSVSQALTYSCNANNSLLINTTSCVPTCNPGYQLLNNTCSLCPSGSYGLTGSSCIPCPLNTYSSLIGASLNRTCQACPFDSYTLDIGSISIDNCTCYAGLVLTNGVCKCANNTVFDDNGICQSCSNGYLNVGDSSCTCNSGFVPINNYQCVPSNYTFTININGSCPLTNSITLNVGDQTTISCGDYSLQLMYNQMGVPSNDAVINCSSSAKCNLNTDPYGNYSCTPSGNECTPNCNKGFTATNPSLTCKCDDNGGTTFSPSLSICQCLSPNVILSDSTCGRQCITDITDINGNTSTLNITSSAISINPDVKLTCGTDTIGRSTVVVSTRNYKVSASSMGSLSTGSITTAISLSCSLGNILFNGKCIPCPPGTYAIAGTSYCAPCSIGYHSNIPGAFYCSPCPVGSYSNFIGASSCNSCSPNIPQCYCNFC